MSLYANKSKIKEQLIKDGYKAIIPKILKKYENFKQFKDDILNKKLPKKCVIKCNHSNGDVFFYDDGIFKNKKGYEISKKFVLAKIKFSLKRNFYYLHYEWCYKNIKPCIYLEEHLFSKNDLGLKEFKFFCNFGKVKLINIVSGRQDDKHLREIFTDEFLNLFEAFQTVPIMSNEEIKKPDCFDEMKSFAEKNSEEFPMLRVDFLIFNEQFWFNEFTFFDCAGNNIFYPDEYNKILGDLFILKE